LCCCYVKKLLQMIVVHYYCCGVCDRKQVGREGDQKHRKMNAMELRQEQVPFATWRLKAKLKMCCESLKKTALLAQLTLVEHQGSPLMNASEMYGGEWHP